MIPDLLLFNGQYVMLMFDLSQDIKSKYAYRTYEILKGNIFLGKLKLTIEEYRFLLKITDKYKQFHELNRRVLSPSIEIVNTYSDINVNYNTIKSGRVVNWIEFTITKKTCKNILENNNFSKKIPTAFETVYNELKNKFNIELTSKKQKIYLI